MTDQRSIYREDLLEGRVALVTGGGTGMGRAMSLGLAAHGAKVAVVSRNMDHLQPVVKEIEGLGGEGFAHTLDVRHADEVAEMHEAVEEALGPVDVLVNNAAGNFLSPFDGMSENGWNAVVNIVLGGTVNVTREVGGRMVERGEGGSIVNMLATYAWVAAPLVSHSGAAKAAVMNLTRSLAVEWAPYDVRVNALAPGPIDTAGARKNLWPDEDQKRRIRDSVPLGRFGSEHEIAQALLYLVSPAAAYVTGEVLTVDGGQWLTGGIFNE